jgi:hypothetical protein
MKDHPFSQMRNNEKPTRPGQIICMLLYLEEMHDAGKPAIIHTRGRELSLHSYCKSIVARGTPKDPRYEHALRILNKTTPKKDPQIVN